MIEVGHDVLSHDRLIFEMLIEIPQQRPPTLVVVHHAAQRVEKERAFEVLVLRRRCIDATLGNDWLLVAHLRLVSVRIPQTVLSTVHVFDVKAFEVSGPAFVNPHVGPVGRGDAVAKPLVPAFVNDDEVESR